MRRPVSTGPLAQQFAQVREESALLADWAEEPLGMESVDVDNVRGRLLEALSAIERHVQDMTEALAQIASDIHPARPADEERPRWLHENSVWWNHYSPQEIARAALPAREKEKE